LLNTTGHDNAAVGAVALLNNDSGTFNTAIGARALFVNNGDGNTAIGADSLSVNTTGADNTAVGDQVLMSNTTGNLNTAMGDAALMSNTTDGGNTAIGSDALRNNTGGGGGNTAIGDQALFASTSGTLNTALGFAAGSNVITASNTICIGADGQNVSNSCYIGQIFGVTSSGGVAVFINAAGKLGTATSSQRFKENIKPMADASKALFALEPVSFRYKKEIDPACTSQFGLVAEDVEKVNPDLIVRDKKGKPYSVRYDQVNAMLLNEFLKEHTRVQELQATVVRQEKAMDALLAHIKEQDSKIQKVSEHLQMDKPAPQVAAIK
jgi:hypothetical protein